MFLSEWREFPSAPCLAEKKIFMTTRVSMLLKSRASPDMLLFSLCKKKRLATWHTNRILVQLLPSNVARSGHVGEKYLYQYYDLYRRLRLQFIVLLMIGAVTPETCRVTLQ